jgi:hypothetical protein
MLLEKDDYQVWWIGGLDFQADLRKSGVVWVLAGCKLEHE